MVNLILILLGVILSEKILSDEVFLGLNHVNKTYNNSWEYENYFQYEASNMMYIFHFTIIFAFIWT